MKKKYIIRYVIHRNGKITEVRVPKEEALKQIKRRLEKDKEMLEILEKL